MESKNRYSNRRPDGSYGAEGARKPKGKWKITKREAKAAEHRKRLVRLVEMKLDPKLTIADICQEFGVSSRTVEKWTSSEEFANLYGELRERYVKYGQVKLQGLLEQSFEVASELFNARSEHVRYEIVAKLWDMVGLGQTEEKNEGSDDREALRKLLLMQAEMLAAPRVDVILQGGSVQPVGASPFLPAPIEGVARELPAPEREAPDPAPEAKPES
jgi:transposase-like protein